VQQSVLIALAMVLGAVAFEAWADRGTFRGHSVHRQSVRLPDATLRLPDATPRLPAYSPRWSQSGLLGTPPRHALKRSPRKYFGRPHPPHGHYAPVYAAPLVVYPATGAPDTQQYAYFCPDNRRYYPDVSECPSEWLAVVPGAPGPPDASYP